MVKQLPLDSVGIIGCGWLGTPLAKQLMDSGVSVVATSSQEENVNCLMQQGISAKQLQLPDNAHSLPSHDVFAQQVLIIAITPQFKQKRIDYADKIQQLVSAAQLSNKVKRILLISSTAIYNGLKGLLSEDSKLDFSADKVEILHNAEHAVLNFSKSSCVLRLAGLVGPNRHPGSFLIKKNKSVNNVLTNGQAKVNLIHQQDAIGLILAILTQESECGVFNGVSDTHASKETYYQAAAKSIDITAPQFEEQNLDATYRVVSGGKTNERLCYQFVYPDLLAWL